MRTGRFLIVGLLSVAGISLVCWSVFGKDHHDYEGAELDSETTLLESSAEPIISEEEVTADSKVEEVIPSIVEKDIIDKVEDEALDERFAGASAKGATQAADITENKNLNAPQMQKEEAPKAEIITIVEDVPAPKADIIKIIDDDPNIEEDIMIATEDQIDWVDLDSTYIDIIEKEPEDEDPVYMVVEESPEFPGGYEAYLQYLKYNIRYPAICRENNIQGRVIVSFVVNKDGAIVEPEVVIGVNPSLDKEALRVISEMPKWKPGTQRGKPVRVKYSCPINFRLN